jgi:tetratricopeptide (TPR) repeat protein
MSKSALVLLAVALLATPLLAQGVKVTLTDGGVVQGTLEGYEQGKYRVRLANGTLREIEERAVQEIVLTDRPAGEKPSSSASSTSDAARAAFERGDYEDALRLIGAALTDLDRERAGLGDLVARIAQAQFDRLMEKRDAAGLSNALRRTLPILSADLRREAVTKLAERFTDLHKSSPNEAFTADFAEILARLAEAGTIDESVRGTLAERFVQLGQAAFEKKNFASAATFFQGAVTVDPSRAGALRGKLVGSLLARAKQLLDAGEPRAAAKAAQEALAADPGNAQARRLAEDAEFAGVKNEIDALDGAEAIAKLREYLARVSRPEDKAWAEQAIKKIQSSPQERLPGVTAQMKKYFPIRPGRWLLYQRGDGEIKERLRTDTVVRDEGVTRVTYTLEEIYRDYAAKKAYVLEIEKDAVILAAGGEREPLLKFPLRAGDSWSWQSHGREFKRRVVSTGGTATVGRGGEERTFTDCVVVEFMSLVEREGAPVQLLSRSTYAPGTGLVKLEFVKPGPEGGEPVPDPEHRKFNLELLRTGQE